MLNDFTPKLIMISIIVVDDHRMFRESISKLLTVEKVANIIAQASNGKELLDLLETNKPDLVLMDIDMPIMDGIEAASKAIAKYPELKILSLSSFGEEKYYFKMVEAGAKGFILKNAGLGELTQAVSEVANGGSWFSSDLLQKIIINISTQPQDNLNDLTNREVEILKLICESNTNEQIAEQLNLSPDTIKWHRANLLSKTNCSNTAGLVIYAIKNKIIEV